jgi:NADH-quinone oxidoreductase subunit N
MYSIISLSISGLLTLFLGFSENKKLVFPLSIFFMLLALGLGFVDWNAPGFYFNNMIEVNNESIVFSSIVISSAVLVLMLSEGFKDFEFAQPAEYFALIQLSLVGTIMMISFENLIMLFLGIEILSVALYVLTGSDKRNIRGNEAAIKYFLMGAFATGILLFGIAMFYGSQGSFDIHALSGLEERSGEELGFLWIGCTFMLIGLTFKVSAAPFHFWSPDVYEGAPTIFTAFMATVVKTAGFVAIYRILSITFQEISDFWWIIIAILTCLSLIIGNLTAVKQDSFKRLMAYSSISHAGFMLMALIGDIEKASGTIMFYSVAYTLATVAAFGVLMALSKHRLENGRSYEKIDLFSGLAKENGLLTAVLVISLLSLSGIPLTAGFWGKFFVFSGVAAKGFYAFLILAILMSAISIYYYFRPISYCFMKAKDFPKVHLNRYNKLILIVCTIGTILLGIFPNVLRSIF